MAICNVFSHQQVREGLRLLVSNRFAQNNSKNNMQVHRNNPVNLGDLIPQTDIACTPKSTVKDVIHYPSSVPSTTSRKDPSYPYSSQSFASNINNDSKTSDILEDSLVNDVFGCESRHLFLCNISWFLLAKVHVISF